MGTSKKAPRSGIGRAACVTLAAVLLCACRVPQEPARTPFTNVVFIGVDTLRADRLGCYGHHRNTSPAIDGMAQQGVLFTNVMAHRALTLPSLASIMTSLHPVSHGVRGNAYRLSRIHQCLAEVLHEEGYATAAFLNNGVVRAQTWEGFDHIGEGWDDAVTTQAIEWLKQGRSQPVFLWLFLYAPHRPYAPPAAYVKRFDPDYDGKTYDEEPTDVALNRTQLSEEELSKILMVYDGEIAYADANVGRLLDAMRELGMDENTLVVLWSDHGEELYDHNCYFYHLGSIYGSALRIPLIFRLPGSVPKNHRVDTLVQEIDIAPTVLDILAIPAPKKWQGESLHPLFTNPARDRGPAFAEFKDTMLSVRTNRYRLIYNPSGEKVQWIQDELIEGRTGNPFFQYEKEELYDIVEDPKESRNIAAERPEVVQALKQRLGAWQHEYQWHFQQSSSDGIDEELREAAAALGYIE